MSCRTADFFSCKPTPAPSHVKRASYSGISINPAPPVRPRGHDRRASWHCGPSLFQPLALDIPSTEDASKVSDLEARLSAAAFDLGASSVAAATTAAAAHSSVFETDSESSNARQHDDAQDSSDDEYGWTSPDDSPLPTPVHSPSLAARPLKPALRHAFCSSSSSSTSSFDGSDCFNKRRCSSVVSFQDMPEVCPTWSQDDYERGGPPPVFKLSIREVLELRQMKMECTPHPETSPLSESQKAEDAATPTPTPAPIFSKTTSSAERPVFLRLN